MMKAIGVCWLWMVLSVWAAERPNIVFLLSDDQDWTGLSVQVHPDVAGSKNAIIQTPNLEKLAAEGMRFSAAYAPSPVCASTRISLQTGMNPARLGWTKAGPVVRGAGYKLVPPASRKSLREDEVTIGELLQGAGYATAHFGKWHINGGGPEANGYDVSDGNVGNEAASRYKDPNPVDIFGMGERAVAFMAKCQEEKKPFFIQMSYLALHAPENARKATIEKYEKLGSMRRERGATRAALSEDLDDGVGKLVRKIDEMGLGKNTYVIYMSDNGAGGRRGVNDVIAGGKGTIWEGGIRVPLIVRGPGIKANSWCHEQVVGFDLFTTFCAMAGVKTKLPEGVEGGDLRPLFAGKSGPVKRPVENLVFHFPHYQGMGGPQSAIFEGNYKLVRLYEQEQPKLFDLKKDLAEQNDIAAKNPELAKRLDAKLAAYLKNVGAGVPTVNENYDPSVKVEPQRGRRGPGRPGGGEGRPGGRRRFEQ